MARMETDCNVKKLANFFNFLLSILEKLLTADYSLFFLGGIISHFYARKEVPSQIFEQFLTNIQQNLRDNTPLSEKIDALLQKLL